MAVLGDSVSTLGVDDPSSSINGLLAQDLSDATRRPVDLYECVRIGSSARSLREGAENLARQLAGEEQPALDVAMILTASQLGDDPLLGKDSQREYRKAIEILAGLGAPTLWPDCLSASPSPLMKAHPPLGLLADPMVTLHVRRVRRTLQRHHQRGQVQFTPLGRGLRPGPEVFDFDGYHLSAVGHRLLADRLISPLKATLDTAPAMRRRVIPTPNHPPATAREPDLVSVGTGLGDVVRVVAARISPKANNSQIMDPTIHRALVTLSDTLDAPVEIDWRGTTDWDRLANNLHIFPTRSTAALLLVDPDNRSFFSQRGFVRETVNRINDSGARVAIAPVGGGTGKHHADARAFLAPYQLEGCATLTSPAELVASLRWAIARGAPPPASDNTRRIALATRSPKNQTKLVRLVPEARRVADPRV